MEADSSRGGEAASAGLADGVDECLDVREDRDIDEAAEDLDHLITPEERFRIAMARQ
jgi:hypothetical protein